MKFNKRITVLFIDSDLKEHFIMEQMLKGDIDLSIAGSVNNAIDYYREHHEGLNMIILCVDYIDHISLMNDLYKINKDGTKKVILTTKLMDSEYMHRLLTVFGALDYLHKPFTKKNLSESLQTALKKEYPFPVRLHHDLELFNQCINMANQVDDNTGDLNKSSISTLGFSTLDDQVITLKKSIASIAKKLKLPELPKAKRPNILCIDDEEHMLDIYQGFLKGRPFHAHYSKNLTDSKALLSNINVDIIILDLGLPDGHGVNLLQHLYNNSPADIFKPDVMVVSSYFEKHTVVNVIRSGARVYINKPMSSKKLISMVYQIIYLRYVRNYLAKNIKSSQAQVNQLIPG